MANEPIQGLPYPDLTGAPPNVPADIKALADAIAPRSVMRFASIAARDAALPAPVDGMACFVAADETYYGRVGGAWVVLWRDTGWQNITIASGWATQGSGTPQVRRIGRVVFMRGIIRPDPAGNIPTSSSAIATIPVGYRPGEWTYYSTAGSTANTNIRMLVKDNGEIDIAANNTSSTWVSLAVPPWTV